MTVAVQQRREKEDPLQTIMKGLGVANQILGLKQNIDAVTKDPNELSQKELLQLQAGGLKAVEPGTEGALAGTFKLPGGGQTAFAPGLTAAQERQFGIQEQKFSKQVEEANKKAEKLAQQIEEKKKKDITDQEAKLRSEYWQSGAKETTGALRAFKKVKAAATKDNPTGADDIALIFGYMKTLDPTSTVREGEFATAQNSGSIPETLMARYNQAVNGQRLTVDQRQNILMSAANQMKSQLDLQQELDSRFTDLAQRSGADVEDVVDPQFKAAVDELEAMLSGGFMKPQQNLSNQSIQIPGEGTATGQQKEKSDRDAALEFLQVP